MSRTEEYYRYLATGQGSIPKPLTREEQYLYTMCTELDPEKLAFAKNYSEQMETLVDTAEDLVDQAETVRDSIPQDYTTLSNDVTELKEDLIALEQEGYPYASISEAVNAWADDHEAEIINNYVTPQMFGAKGDGVADDVNAFWDMFDWMQTHDIRTAFIPKGTYNISESISVPEKMTMDGCGYDSFIYLTTGTTLGVAITNGGSDVTIQNIRVGNTGDTSPIGGSGYGGIGISVYSYATVKNKQLTEKANANGIIINNIYATGSYPLQIESGDGYTLDNISISNIFAPNGLVSSTAGAGTSQNNIHFKNINCDLFRLDYNAGGGTNNSIEDSTVNYLRINSSVSKNYSVKNVRVNTLSSSLYKATSNSNCALYVNGDILFDNVALYNNDSVTTGIYIYDGHSVFRKVNVLSNFGTKNFDVRISVSQAFYDCDLGSVNSTLVGIGYNTTATLVGGAAGNSLYIDNTTTFVNTPTSTLTEASGDFPCRIYRKGYVCRFRMYKVLSANLAKDAEVCAIGYPSFVPSEDRYVRAKAFKIDQSLSYDIELIIKTTGKVIVAPTYALTLSNSLAVDRLFVDDMYIL